MGLGEGWRRVRHSDATKNASAMHALPAPVRLGRARRRARAPALAVHRCVCVAVLDMHAVSQGSVRPWRSMHGRYNENFSSAIRHRIRGTTVTS